MHANDIEKSIFTLSIIQNTRNNLDVTNRRLFNKLWYAHTIRGFIFLKKNTGSFWSRGWHRQTWLASSHNHITITTKI